MKTRSQTSPGRRLLAFTLPDVLVSMSIFSLILMGVLASFLFGLRLNEISRIKLGASGEARQAIGKMMEEIRAAKTIVIGSDRSNVFTPVVENTTQLGNAIQVYPTLATNIWIVYFVDPVDHQLKRGTNNSSALAVVANSVSNNVVFSSEDFDGVILTNNQNNRVIGLSLQFYQLQNPNVAIGPAGLYDFYQLRTKITRRNLE